MKGNIDKFFEAAESGNRPLIESMLQEEPLLAEQRDINGRTAAFAAAEHGHSNLIRYLVEYSRASFNVRGPNHQSILHYAAKSNNEECFSYLAERVSIDPLEVNSQLETPLDIAIEHNSFNIIRYYDSVLGINPDMLYKNPVVTGAYPDPSILRVGSDYYMVHSSFTFFPCIPVLHSRDLIHWNTIGHGISDSNFIDLREVDDGRGFWAPDLSFYNGRFYITATFRRNDGEARLRRQMVVWSEKAEGPYSKPTFIDEDGIDPSIFTDDNGKRYMLLNRGARIFEISENGDRRLSESVLLWYGANKRAPEAPHLLKKDRYYYLFVSEGGTGRNHQISVARSRELYGTYEPCPYNPILKQNDPNHPIQRSGHGKLVSTPEGEWFIAYLCSRTVDQKYSILGRETSLDRVTWTKDGWPLINNNKGPSGVSLKPLPESQSIPNVENPMDWVFIRNPDEEFYRFDKEDQMLTLIGGSFDLNEKTARNLLVCRQKSLKCRFEVDMMYSPEVSDSEAGLTCYYDTTAYLKYYISKDNEGYKLNLLEYIDSEQILLSHAINYNGSIQLRIESDSLLRSFWYRCNSEEPWMFFNEVKNAYYLSDEGVPGKKFTGTVMGFYCLDHLGTDRIEATFKDFKIKDMDYHE